VIAQTIAERCATTHTLAASFFFSRGAGRRSRIIDFIPTLAYQLTLSVPDTKPSIYDVLQSDTTLPHHSLEDQFQKLMINPMLALSQPIRPMLVVIDGLDECDDKDAIAEFVGILLHASQDRQFPFLFLLTGRAENHILQMFSPPESQLLTYSLALQDFDAHADIHTFLQSRFSTVLNQNPRLMRGVQLPWPSAPDIEGLVEKSSGLFIFASTMVDFITDGRGAPQRKLEKVLRTHAGLDPLYTQVFSAVGPVEGFDKVIGTIILLRQQLSITALGYLLQLETGDILQALLAIQSILRISEDNDKHVELVHSSLRDFLMEKQRSGIYFIDPPVRHAFIVIDCLKIIMRDVNKRRATGGPGLYACLHWCSRLDAVLIEGDMTIFAKSLLSADLTSRLKGFKSQSFDYWVNTLIHEPLTHEIMKTSNSMISRLRVNAADLLFASRWMGS
jgi:hypothetical protein